MIEPFRTLGWSTWLGWQIESNWADLRLFILYLVVKPVCGSLMLVCMFFAAKYAADAGGAPPMPTLPLVSSTNWRVLTPVADRYKLPAVV